jgi:hypothetical protein
MTAKPGYDPVPLSEFEPLLLSTKEQLDKYWPRASKLVDRCIKRAMRGEITVDDVYNMVLQQKAFVFVFKYDKGLQPDVKLVLVLEICDYPRLPTMNILALAGSNLGEFYDRFWNKVCGWAYMNGIRSFEGYVAPAMQKVISKYGFKPTYTVMRLDLTEA